MDPNANLKEQLEIAAYIAQKDAEGYVHNVPAIAIQATRLAELVREMNGWLAKGGFLPTAWRGHRGAL